MLSILIKLLIPYGDIQQCFKMSLHWMISKPLNAFNRYYCIKTCSQTLAVRISARDRIHGQAVEQCTKGHLNKLKNKKAQEKHGINKKWIKYRNERANLKETKQT